MAVELGYRRGYRLYLANGLAWHITANEAARPWVEKLAAILELKICDRNGYPNLIFLRREKVKESGEQWIRCLDAKIQGDLPWTGWKVRKLPAVRIWSHPEVLDVIFEIGHGEDCELDILRMLLAFYPIFERAQDSGGLPFHAAVVERQGIGILLAASGNTGKSTCCSRLPSPWQPLCDDKALVVRDEKKQYQVHPLPTWSNYFMKRSEQTWNVQSHVPLAAIFFLEQAEIDNVVPMGRGQAAVLIAQSAMQVYDPNWSNVDRAEVRDFRIKLFDNGCDLARVIPAFKLQVSLNGRFWEKIEKVLP